MIRRSFTLVTIRNDTLSTHAFLFSLISKAMMATLVKRRGTNILRMAIRASAKPKP
jgi:hypothetical protein